MAKMTRALAVSGLVVAATWGSGAVHAQRSAGLNTTRTIQISAATKTLDLGADSNAQTPPSWQNVGFDDSSWQPSVRVPADVIACGTQNSQQLASTPDFWGTHESDSYLFRETFNLPTAKSYYGSVLNMSINANSDSMGVSLNGQDLQFPAVDGNYENWRPAIGQYLRQGKNVLAILAHPANTGGTGYGQTSSGGPCSLLTFALAINITGIQTNPPTHASPSLSTILPGQNAVLSNSNSLPFSWDRYNKAAYYYLQMWLTDPTGGPITSHTTTMYSMRLTGTSYTLNVSQFAKGAYTWRMMPVGGLGKPLAGWTPDQTVTLR